LRRRVARLVEWIAPFSEGKVTHFPFHAARVTLAAAGDGAAGGDFPENAIEPG
jgi:hypothetical protein